jgi:hypothetical protein
MDPTFYHKPTSDNDRSSGKRLIPNGRSFYTPLLRSGTLTAGFDRDNGNGVSRSDDSKVKLILLYLWSKSRFRAQGRANDRHNQVPGDCVRKTGRQS